MHDQGSEDSGQRSHGTDGSGASAAPDTRTDAAPEPAQAVPSTGRRRGFKLAAYVAAGTLAVAVGFGLARVVDSSGPPVISSAIPSPAQQGGAFVEDDNLTAQDNQTNILQSTAPGLVHIISGQTPVGTGMVLTPSGKVLTTYLPSPGADNLSAEYVVSGATFRAKVIGTDAAAGLALVQLEGADGRAFSTLQVGNSATLADTSRQSKQFSWHLAGEIVDTAIGTSGRQDALTLDIGTLISVDGTASVDGGSRTGLMESTLQSVPTNAIGGPLVNLNGQVIGITVAGAGKGLDITGYAMPINHALAVAAQIDARSRRS